MSPSRGVKRGPSALHYFAYGSNLDVAAMRSRCMASRPLGLGTLHGFEFFIGASGYASVRPRAGAVVHGLVWALAPRDLPALDRYEAVGSALYRKTWLSIRFRGSVRPMLIYVVRLQQAGAPRPGYMELVLASADIAGLPSAYVRNLRQWLVAPTAGEPHDGPGT